MHVTLTPHNNYTTLHVHVYMYNRCQKGQKRGIGLWHSYYKCDRSSSISGMPNMPPKTSRTRASFSWHNADGLKQRAAHTTAIARARDAA